MKIPSEVQLVGYNIPIIITTDLTVMSDARGLYNTLDNTIYIADNLSQQQKESVLIHEYIEAINDSLDLGLTEQQICGLEQGIYQLVTQVIR